jgi:hypothetical protein
MLSIARTVALATVAFALPAAGQQPPAVDAGGAAGMATLTAKIEAIDYASRVVAVKGPLGRTVALKVDDRVRNLGKVKAGDEVVLKYAEALTLALTGAGAARDETVITTAPATAPVAAKPGVVTAQQVRIVARIEAVDVQRQVVLLEGPHARYVEVKVTDAGRFNELKIGDNIRIAFTEAVVVEVVAPGK